MNEKPMMACGCAANSERTGTSGKKHDPIPCCSIHDCIEIVKRPNLIGRQAKCGCGRIEPSNPDHLAFFEFRGEGSREATKICKCGYAESAHDKPHIAAKCQKFIPRGPQEYDKYYCGCRGWD